MRNDFLRNRMLQETREDNQFHFFFFLLLLLDHLLPNEIQLRAQHIDLAKDFLEEKLASMNDH